MFRWTQWSGTRASEPRSAERIQLSIAPTLWRNSGCDTRLRKKRHKSCSQSIARKLLPTLAVAAPLPWPISTTRDCRWAVPNRHIVSLLRLLMSTKGITPPPKPYSRSRNFRYPQGLTELERFGVRIPDCTGITASQLHATSTVADESNVAKVGIGGDDGHDEHKDGK